LGGVAFYEAHDSRDGGGRATPGAVAEDAEERPKRMNAHDETVLANVAAIGASAATETGSYALFSAWK
ncbi:MAG: hypothetical protein AAB315_00815, partial [Pseudomonadota bacterium]